MLCFSNGMCFIGLTPLFSERPCSVVHFRYKGIAEFRIPRITAQDHLTIQIRQCREELIPITLSQLAEDDDIPLIGMLKLLPETNGHLMLDEQLICIIFRHVNEGIVVI